LQFEHGHPAAARSEEIRGLNSDQYRRR
jgi:hypothetical protein